VHRALAAGIVVVAASGNNGVPLCEQPAARDGLLCVGAVDKREQRSFFSSFGSGLGLVAPGGSGTGVPGEDVLSTYKGSATRSWPAPRRRAARVRRRRAAGRARGARAGGGQADPRHGDRPGRPGQRPVYGAGLVNARAAVAGLGGGAPAGGGGGSRARCRSSSGEEEAAGADRAAARDPRAGARRPGGPRAGARDAQGHLIARGSKRVRAGRATTVVARLTARGRRHTRGRARVRCASRASAATACGDRILRPMRL
jgi:hypothetical protein